MECPKCGKELEEGKLLCEFCGEEIKIVPDFDIELENQLRESLSSMMDDITQGEADHGQDTKIFLLNSDAGEYEQNVYDESDEDIKDNLIDYYEEDSVKSKTVMKIIALVCSPIIISLIIFFIIFRINDVNENSFEYQYQKAVEYAQDNDYSKAVIYMERAVALDPDNGEASFLLAKYLEKNDQQLGAVAILQELLNNNPDYEKQDEVYDMILSIKKSREEYSDMNRILKKCNISRIISKYNKYAALEPVFNKKGGTYDEVISITLSGNTQGIMYYTLDGTNPTTNSMVYETPILLESGEYTIRAMFVNMYGVCSDVVSENYKINLTMPKEPVINLDSGVYNEPKMIQIYHDNNTKIYYTMDGSVPDKTSIRYSSGIEMPYGISNFSFVAINEDGLASEVVNRTYHLEIEANFSTEVALQVLMNNLWADGKISDLEGHVANKLGQNQYKVQTLVNIDGFLYYIVHEEYVDTTGNKHNTNNIFAINSQNGDLYRAYKIDEGKYNIKAFS